MVLLLSCIICFGMFCSAVTAAINHFSAHRVVRGPSSPRPLPALLKRFARLRKAAPPDRGAALKSVQELFPQWGVGSAKDTDGERPYPDNAFRELALGISMLAQHLQPPATDLELSVSENESNEDSDL
tara:strand:- start:1675 stop:2058 length:384 start_codon:yes stop_codon:yes gene_type:complete